MPIYKLEKDKLSQLEVEDFKNEEELHVFFEKNLEKLLNIQLVASELWTGGSDGGYIDTAGLDENYSPVVIEYKWKENNQVINQGLYYIDQIIEHRGDFELKAQNFLNGKEKINWKQPRLIIVAPSFTKFDKHAVKRMGGNIELIKYKRYKGNYISLETEFEGSKISAKPGIALNNKESKEENGDPFAGRLQWLSQGSKSSLGIFNKLRESILNMDEEITEKRFKNGISFRIDSKPFVSLAPWREYTRVYILNNGKLEDPKNIARDIKGLGSIFRASHDFPIDNENQIPYALTLIKQAYESAS